MKISYLAGILLGMSAVASSFAQTPPASPPYVVDSTGKVVGPLLEGDYVLLTLPSKQQVMTLISKDGFAPVEEYAFYFLSNDCSGTPYLDAGGLPPVAFLVPRVHTSLAVPGPDATTMGYGSVSYRGASYRYCRKYGGTMYGAQRTFVKLDSLQFTPPFEIKLK